MTARSRESVANAALRHKVERRSAETEDPHDDGAADFIPSDEIGGDPHLIEIDGACELGSAGVEELRRRFVGHLYDADGNLHPTDE